MTPPCCFAVIANSPAGWGHPALRGNKKSSRGRGGALPRPRHNGNSNIVGRFVGAAYMPPAAAARILRTIGQAGTGEQCSPLQEFIGSLRLYLLSKNFPLPLTSGLPYAIVCLLVVTNPIQLPPFSINRLARVPPVPGGFMESLVSVY